MRVTQVFSNSRVFVFLSALKKVSASIANIICIPQITFEFIDNSDLRPVLWSVWCRLCWLYSKMMNDSSKCHAQFWSLIFILNYNKTIIEFGFCYIRKNQGHGKCNQLRPCLFRVSQKPHLSIVYKQKCNTLNGWTTCSNSSRLNSTGISWTK